MVARRWVAMVGLGAALVAGNAAADLDTSWFTIPIAASRNQTDQVQMLLEDPMNDPNATESQGGRTALDYAASFNNVPMAQMLLAHNAHPDARDRSGNTALHYAAERGNLDVLRLLLAAKASPDAINRDGITPLMLAADKSQPAAIRLLLAGGADPGKQDYTGRDARGWAVGKPAVLQALNAGKH